ncbi:prenyltransferase [Thermococcus sp.]|uniref:prenyltransferase n=1 Tax=Thermococcus sp. TaxID=35749 RepID=UPI002622FE94|nr:prenyltransferase [Thermococcus sp.]
MIVDEILSSVDAIQDPYVRAVTYAKLGERLAKARNPRYKTAFMMALETARNMDDPVVTLRALLSIGYSLGKAGLKFSKKIYRSVLEDSRVLPPPLRDDLMRTAAMYLLHLGEVGEAVTYALEIQDRRMRNDVLLDLMRANTRLIGKDALKAASRLRKSKLILDNLEDEPHRSKAILELIKAHILLGSYERAIALLLDMGSREWVKMAFKETAFRLKDRGVLGHYIYRLKEVAKELLERFGESFVEELALAMALSGEGFSAAELLRGTENGREALVRISLELLERDGTSLPNLIYALDEEEAELVGKAVMNAILERPEQGSGEIVSAIGKSTRSEEVWAKIARYYVLIGKTDAAAKIGSVIEDPRLRSVVMADVAHHLLKEGRVEDAIDAALEVRDGRFSSMLVSEILIKALENELPGRVRQWNGSKR